MKVWIDMGMREKKSRLGYEADGKSRCRSALAKNAAMFFVAALLLIGPAIAAAGDINPGPINYFTDCEYGCTADDVKVTGYEVVDENGDPLTCMECEGDTASAYIKVTYQSTANKRYNVFLLFGIDKDGNGVITLTGDPITNEQYRVALADVITQNTEMATTFPISWPCDQPLYAVGPNYLSSDPKVCKGPVLHWDNNDQGYDKWTEYNCSPTSQCWCSGPTTIPAPCRAIAPDFSICQGTVVEDQLFYDNGAACGDPKCTAVLAYDFDSSTPGSYDYNITCSSGDCSVKDTGTVTVNPLPAVNLTSNSPVCIDEKLTLTADTTGTVCNGGLKYEWYKGNDLISGATGSTYEITNAQTSDSGTYEVVVTCLATECSNNDTTEVSVIPCAPEISCPPDITVECDESLLPADTGSPSVTTKCPTGYDPEDVTFTDKTSNGDCPNNYTIERNWTVIDNCGNIAWCIQNITVQDTTKPVIDCPDDVTIECSDPLPTTEATATDNCDTSVTIASSDERIDGDCPNNYTVERNWTATDDCGNVAWCIQTITVQDTEAPTFNEPCPADKTVECDSVLEQEILTAADNCDESVTVVPNEVTIPGDCANNYTLIRYWNATDVCGNEASCKQTITVRDTTAPTFNEACPEDTTVECDSVPDQETLTAADNCDESVTVVPNEVRIDGDCANNYTLIRYWNATDVCGNKASCVQVITVQDTTAPIIICPADITIDCTELLDPLENTKLGNATATDNCGIPTITYTDAGTCNVTRTWTATDSCGNIDSCVQEITRICFGAAIQIDKRADVSSAKPGDVINYTYNVTNTGNVNLSNLVIQDDKIGLINATEG
ncbi:MAG: DUF7507 domain-containing protein [Methanothrix sp.]